MYMEQLRCYPPRGHRDRAPLLEKNPAQQGSCHPSTNTRACESHETHKDELIWNHRGILIIVKEYRYTKEGRAIPEEKCLYWVLWALWVLWVLAGGKFKFPGIIHWVTRLTIVTSLPCFELEQIRDHFSQPTWGSSGTKVALDLL